MIINLTPHPLTIAGRSIPPDGRVPRVEQRITTVGEVDGLPLTAAAFGEVQDLPDPAPDTWYVVSRMVAEAADRDDLLIPGKAVRDGQGRQVGAESLSRPPGGVWTAITEVAYVYSRKHVTMRGPDTASPEVDIELAGSPESGWYVEAFDVHYFSTDGPTFLCAEDMPNYLHTLLRKGYRPLR